MSQVYYMRWDDDGEIFDIGEMDKTCIDFHAKHLKWKQDEWELVTFEQFRTAKSNLHRIYRNVSGSIGFKEKIAISCDKQYIDIDGVDAATVAWAAPAPVSIYVNGKLPGKHQDSIQLVTEKPTVYRIAVDDARYYSDPIW